MESNWVTIAQQTLPRALEEVKQTVSKAGWITEKTKDGITITTNTTNDNKPLAKSEGEFNAPAQAIVNFFMNTQNTKKWSPRLKTIETLQESGNIRLIKQVLKMRWPIDNREILTVVTTFNENGLTYIIEKSVNIDNIPVAKDHIRAVVNVCGYIIEPLENNRTKVTYVNQYDPNGNVPMAIRRKVQSKLVRRLMIAKKELK
ncbi:unnamed protein product [Blepharisma stoltei]|uniref:START domain-containing protein n=1 Tax=Blepharisma stoltei TaxID=1481888 RepID=A0AAU9JPR7_9CILI|nr:unnamed protein product [Blepharisma stoltei]